MNAQLGEQVQANFGVLLIRIPRILLDEQSRWSSLVCLVNVAWITALLSTNCHVSDPRGVIYRADLPRSGTSVFFSVSLFTNSVANWASARKMVKNHRLLRIIILLMLIVIRFSIVNFCWKFLKCRKLCYNLILRTESHLRNRSRNFKEIESVPAADSNGICERP